MIGGIRYYSLLTVLPLFHILFELLEWPTVPAGTKKRRDLALGLQTMILVLGVLVRGSAFSLVGAIAIAWLALAWNHRREPGRLKVLFSNLTVMGISTAFVLSAIVASIPRDYLTEGRFGTVIWQRVTESVGAVNPFWPFPGANDLFDCKTYLPDGLPTGGDDRFGICIWFLYAAEHAIPAEKTGEGTNSALYEAALREAFFKIATHYPGELLKTFFYYKPSYIPWSISRLLKKSIYLVISMRRCDSVGQ
jgi:hypothetical protein